MSERLLMHLQQWLTEKPVVLASVLATRGATPRKGGSRMLISHDACFESVGGGLAEAQVIAAALRMLTEDTSAATVNIDLTGRPGSAGICGGSMRIGLQRWSGSADQAHAARLLARLQSGEAVRLSNIEGTSDADAQWLQPSARLLIIGGGHCGLALHDLAKHLNFDIWVYDERQALLAAFVHATQLSGPADSLHSALQTSRKVFAVCLNRDFHCDLAALRVLTQNPPVFIGMMGSGKRIAEVRVALAAEGRSVADLHAPVGIEIDAQTPHEIAVSILAQLIQRRRLLEAATESAIHI